MIVRPMTVDVRGTTVHCHVLSLTDRRSRPRSKEWLLCKSVETILFGNEVTRVLPHHTFLASFFLH